MARPNLGRTRRGESNLARRIEMERRSRGWSYAALAEEMTRAGCTINASGIYKIEKGDPPRKITVDEMLALADVFEVDLDNLLTPVEVLRKERAKDLLADMEVGRGRIARGILIYMQAIAEYEILGVADPELQEFARNLASGSGAGPDPTEVHVTVPEGVLTVDPREIFEALEVLREKVREAAIAAVAASGLAEGVSS